MGPHVGELSTTTTTAPAPGSTGSTGEGRASGRSSHAILSLAQKRGKMNKFGIRSIVDYLHAAEVLCGHSVMRNANLIPVGTRILANWEQLATFGRRSLHKHAAWGCVQENKKQADSICNIVSDSMEN